MTVAERLGAGGVNADVGVLDPVAGSAVVDQHAVVLVAGEDIAALLSDAVVVGAHGVDAIEVADGVAAVGVGADVVVGDLVPLRLPAVEEDAGVGVAGDDVALPAIPAA